MHTCVFCGKAETLTDDLLLLHHKNRWRWTHSRCAERVLGRKLKRSLVVLGETRDDLYHDYIREAIERVLTTWRRWLYGHRPTLPAGKLPASV